MKQTPPHAMSAPIREYRSPPWQLSLKFLVWLTMVTSLGASLAGGLPLEYVVGVILAAIALERWLYTNPEDRPAQTVRKILSYLFCVVAGFVNGVVLGVLACFVFSWVVPSLHLFLFAAGGTGVGTATAIAFPRLFENGWLFPLRF